MNKRILIAVILLWMSGALHPTVHAGDFLLNVSLDTSPLQGEPGLLAFDFVGGSPVQNNAATILNFISDATLGDGSSSGDVTGSLVPGPLRLGDTSFFNQWLQVVIFGSDNSFQLKITINNFPERAPDQLSFFLLDTRGSAMDTSDPSGANALFVIDMDSDNPVPVVFESDFASVTIEQDEQN